MSTLTRDGRGAVYDRGYRPYDGVRGGRNAARLALWRLTVRRALGLRRSWRQKVLPWSLLAMVMIPAMVDVGVRYATRNTQAREIDFEFLTFRDYLGVSTFLLLFVAVSAPDVVCPDRHDRVLPLIFSRQLTGTDYVVAKVGGIFSIVFGFAFLPQVLLFVGQMLVHDDGSLDYLGDNADMVWKVPVAIAILAFYLAMISVAVASLTDRRIVGGIALVGFMLITSAISEIFVAANEPRPSAMALFDLWELPLYLRDLVFDGEFGLDMSAYGVGGGPTAAVFLYLAIVTAAAAVLQWRYREVRL